MSGSLALLEDGHIVAEWTLRSARTHNRRLLGSIDRLLREAGWSMDSIDGFAVAGGPGSFTGLRIGMTTMKTLAWVTGKPYAAIPSLDALAFPLGFSAHPVCTLLDARKNEVYFALFEPDGKGNLTIAHPYAALSPARLVEKIVQPAIVCGDGWLLYRNQLKRKLGARAVEPAPSFHVIRAGSVAELARRRFARGQSDDPATSAPLYVRPSEAEIHYPHLAEKSGERPEIT